MPPIGALKAAPPGGYHGSLVARRAPAPAPRSIPPESRKGGGMSESVDRAWVPLNAHERRVLGVLVEKAKTTPDVYPLTLAAVVTGCNQKSNRDPVTAYDADDVEETLAALRKKGAVVQVDSGGRVVRFKHLFYEWLRVNKVESAVMVELLLRGSQTEGDLRARAGRMEPIADLPTLQAVLDGLQAKDLVVYQTPRGSRGAVVTHNLFPPKDLDRERGRSDAIAAAASSTGPAPTPAARPAYRDEPPRPSPAPEPAGPRVDPAEVAALRAEVESLRATVDGLVADVRELKSALGV